MSWTPEEKKRFSENIPKLLFLIFYTWVCLLIIKDLRNINDFLGCYGEGSGSACRFYFWFHNINLPVHEFGHLLFMPLGEFMSILGGSLTQVLLPIAFTGSFWIRKDYYATGICGAWVGESTLSVAHYMMDASRRYLPLIGGNEDAHDWNNLLVMMGMLDKDWLIGGFTYFMGSLIIIMSLGLSYFIVFRDGKFIEINLDKK